MPPSMRRSASTLTPGKEVEKERTVNIAETLPHGPFSRIHFRHPHHVTVARRRAFSARSSTFTHRPSPTTLPPISSAPAAISPLPTSPELRHRVDVGAGPISAQHPKAGVSQKISIQTADRAFRALRPPLRGDPGPCRVPDPRRYSRHRSRDPRPSSQSRLDVRLKPHGVCEAFCSRCRDFSRPALPRALRPPLRSDPALVASPIPRRYSRHRSRDRPPLVANLPTRAVEASRGL